MKKIKKFKLTGEDTFDLPVCSEVLCVHSEHGYQAVLWIMIDPTETQIHPRTFLMFEDDVPAELSLRYIGAAVQSTSRAFHVFEKFSFENK
jgi:hypothetical protein